MEGQETRAALEEHWSGPPADDLETTLDRADRIYHDDVGEYPQSGERIMGRRNLRALRETYPCKGTFDLRHIRRRGELWVTEYASRTRSRRRSGGLRGSSGWNIKFGHGQASENHSTKVGEKRAVREPATQDSDPLLADK